MYINKHTEYTAPTFIQGDLLLLAEKKDGLNFTCTQCSLAVPVIMSNFKRETYTISGRHVVYMQLFLLYVA